MIRLLPRKWRITTVPRILEKVFMFCRVCAIILCGTLVVSTRRLERPEKRYRRHQLLLTTRSIGLYSFVTPCVKNVQECPPMTTSPVSALIQSIETVRGDIYCLQIRVLRGSIGTHSLILRVHKDYRTQCPHTTKS